MAPITSLPDLHTHLQDAVRLEFATIPPYLCGYWTIKNPTNACAVLIKQVAVSEMRHMTIVANCLIATGGHPDFTAVPQYPSYLPDGEMEFEVGLLPFGPEFLAQSLRIEDPTPKVVPAAIQGRLARGLAIPRRHRLLAMGQRYPTIGDFYRAIIQGIQLLVGQLGEAAVFPNNSSTNPDQQVDFPSGGALTKVSGSAEAVTRLTDIIDEGEGANATMFDENGQLAHYYLFQEISLGKRYKPGDTPGNPTGVSLTVPTADGIFPMLANPKLQDYPLNSQARSHAEAFNTLFRTVVTDLQSAFSGHPDTVDQARVDMQSLAHTVQALFQDSVPNHPGLVAGPTFELPAV